MIKHTEEFRREAVRIALTSGLPRERVASDLGVGKSTLHKWISQYRPSDLVAAPQADLARENERLRLENRVLKEERDILKKAQNAWGSSSRASGREVRIRGELASCVASRGDLPDNAGQPSRLSIVACAAHEPPRPDRPEGPCPYTRAI